MGESITLSDGEEKVIITAKQIRYIKQPPNRYDSPPKNGTYVAIDIHCEAVGTGYMNPVNFFVRDSAGTRYHSFAASLTLDDTLQYADLEPGEKIRGWIAFDVPEVDGLELVWERSGRSLAVWRFSGIE